jgi:hypothetical protein
MYADDKELYFILLSFFKKKKAALRDHHASCEHSFSVFVVNWQIFPKSGINALPLYVTITSNFLQLIITLLSDSNGFWRWCITLRISKFLDFVHRPVFVFSKFFLEYWTMDEVQKLTNSEC